MDGWNSTKNQRSFFNECQPKGNATPLVEIVASTLGIRIVNGMIFSFLFEFILSISLLKAGGVTIILVNGDLEI